MKGRVLRGERAPPIGFDVSALLLEDVSCVVESAAQDLAT